MVSMIGPPPSLAEASSSSRAGRGGREDAIETLIDIDQHGAAFRFANTMVRHRDMKVFK
jgi:hypothetical protein